MQQLAADALPPHVGVDEDHGHVAVGLVVCREPNENGQVHIIMVPARSGALVLRPDRRILERHNEDVVVGRPVQGTTRQLLSVPHTRQAGRSLVRVVLICGRMILWLSC